MSVDTYTAWLQQTRTGFVVCWSVLYAKLQNKKKYRPTTKAMAAAVEALVAVAAVL